MYACTNCAHNYVVRTCDRIIAVVSIQGRRQWDGREAWIQGGINQPRPWNRGRDNSTSTSCPLVLNSQLKTVAMHSSTSTTLRTFVITSPPLALMVDNHSSKIGMKHCSAVCAVAWWRGRNISCVQVYLQAVLIL